MLMSKLVVKTLREAPADAEAISHQLLVRAGYIRRLASGIYSFLPLGLRVLRKVEAIVREEFDSVGAQELFLPALHPVEIWQETNRINTMDDVLMKVEVRGGDFVLGPTHEEAVIATVSPDLSSYRDLPATVYQIQTKFRAEARPRFGLLRTREFMMADAYSFDVDKEAMRSTYKMLFDAYCAIFDRIGIEYFPVEADAGSIGGDVNHEFMVPAAIGEDHFAYCKACGYAANIEAATRGERTVSTITSPAKEMRKVATPNSPTIKAVVDFLSGHGFVASAETSLKSMIVIDSQGAYHLLLVPGDRKVRIPSGMRAAEASDFEANPHLHLGYIGPIGMREVGVTIWVDRSISEEVGYCTGANEVGYHLLDVVLGRDYIADHVFDLVEVVDGDPCPRCDGDIALVRSVEAGHTFQLGLTYSNKIKSARFSSEDGSEAPYYMGCYGIGISRIPAVVAEVSHDANGLIWPLELSPFEVVVVALGYGSNDLVTEAADRIYDSLIDEEVDALLDDRNLAAGVKLKDADLIGITYQIVVGARGVADGNVEVKDRRTGEASVVAIAEVTDFLLDLLA
ncbi:MAG: proline--tRNA ligase [Actinomycetota bacterium]|nr:proline--tRNA ligase [Actinomycetota bacterium]